ncbi:hypothetical protein [Dactylosporangium sp. CA-092794]|uniref:hypothetical protein n=1 Tax=Dactylosporangium sp. CA-092794 TaxID=3239929 RepID=UPI003D8C6977
MNQRPRDVWTASLMLAFFGLLGVIVSGFLLSLFGSDDDLPGAVFAALVAGAVLAAAEIVAAVFVFLGHEWARWSAIGLCVLNGLSGLLTLTAGVVPQACLGVVTNIALIVVLNKDDVRSWCQPA